MNRPQVYCLLLCMWCGTAASETIPWPQENFSRFSDREDLRIVLRDLGSAGGFLVSASDRVAGEVNGSFNTGTYSEAYEVLARMFSLISYFDGSVLWVSTFDEIESVTIQLKSISVQSFENKLANMGVMDTRWSWRALESEKIVYLTGPARYVELVSELATKLDTPKKFTSGIVYSQVDENGITMFSDKPFSRAKSLTHE